VTHPTYLTREVHPTHLLSLPSLPYPTHLTYATHQTYPTHPTYMTRDALAAQIQDEGRSEGL